jgi:hypothetical protein
LIEQEYVFIQLFTNKHEKRKRKVQTIFFSELLLLLLHIPALAV